MNTVNTVRNSFGDYVREGLENPNSEISRGKRLLSAWKVIVGKDYSGFSFGFIDNKLALFVNYYDEFTGTWRRPVIYD